MADDDRGPEGVYRDGRHVVVDLRGSRFPFRCVKTNQPVRYHSSHVVRLRQHAIVAYTLWAAAVIYVRFKLRQSYGVPGESIGVAFALLTYWLMMTLIRRSQILWIGLDEQYAERRKRRARIGWRLTLGGLIALIVVTVAETTAVLGGLFSSPQALLDRLPVWIALLALCGIPFLIAAYFPILWCRKSKEPFLWLGGANRDFLASLPAWEAERGRQHTPEKTEDGSAQEEINPTR